MVDESKTGEAFWRRRGQEAQDRVERNWFHDWEQEGPSLVVEAM